MQNVGKGDVWDTYWYNNPEAIGQQLYPEGIHKYFDMHSVWGYFVEYQFAWTWITIGDLISPFTFFIPTDILIDIFFGAQWVGFEKYWFWYFPWALGLNRLAGKWFHVKVENGWTMLDG